MKLIPEIFRKEIFIYNKPYTLEIFRWRDKKSRKMTIIVKGLFKITNVNFYYTYDKDGAGYTQLHQWDIHDITNPVIFHRICEPVLTLQQAEIAIAKWLMHNPKLI